VEEGWILLIVGNGNLVTLGAGPRVIDGGAVAVADGLIVDVGATRDLQAKHKGAEFLDAVGAVIMPGLINIHAHGYGAFARGLAIPGEAPRTFLQILQGLWWKLDRALTLEDVYVCAALGFVDGLRNGTTSVFDHHASPKAIAGSLDEEARAAGEVGVRTCLCYEVSDRDGPGPAAEGIEENVRFIRSLRTREPVGRVGGAGRTGDAGHTSDAAQPGRPGRLAGCMGLHASLTLSDATIGRAVEEAGKLGVGCHLHVAEGPEDGADSVARYGKSVVQRLADLGVLGPRSIAAHCVHVDQEDIDLLARTRTIVAHNAQSNMSNAVGVAPALAMVGEGVRVGLGTDGFTTDLFEAAAGTNIVHKLAARDPSVGWEEGQRMALGTNAEVATEFFGGRLGALAPGYGADLIVVDYDPYTAMNEGNFWGHMLFGMRGGQVRHAVVDGRVVMHDRQVLGLDETRLRARARTLSKKVWERFAAR
jgi:putative selenium metabolism protein SsnA